MTSYERLEDLLGQWRTENADATIAATERIMHAVARHLPDPVNPSDPVSVESLNTVLRDEVTEFAVTDVLPRCLQMFAARGLGLPDELRKRVRAESAVAVKRSIRATEFELPSGASRIPYGSLAIAASVGALMGCVILTPLSLLLLGQREPGLIVGGAGGAAGVIVLVAWLSERPTMLYALQRVIGVAGLLAALAGAAKALRQQTLGMIRTAAWIAGCWVLLVLARPRLVLPSRALCVAALGPQVRQQLNHASDLVVALCWAHPLREGPQTTSQRTVGLPGAVVDALSVLHALSTDPETPLRHLKLAADGVLQSVREEGYAWEVVAAGTPYNHGMETRFELFGRIESGQVVETLKPAITRHGALEKRGVLRRHE